MQKLSASICLWQLRICFIGDRQLRPSQGINRSRQIHGRGIWSERASHNACMDCSGGLDPGSRSRQNKRLMDPPASLSCHRAGCIVDSIERGSNYADGDDARYSSVITQRDATLRSRWLLPLGVAAVCVISIVPSSTWQRLATTRVEVESKGVSNRQVIWTAGLGVFGDGNQLLGIGSGTYAIKMASVLGRDAVAHNSFISILVETGLVGSTLFALLLSGLCLGVARMQGWTKVTWMIVMAGWIVGVLSMTGESLKATWLLFSFISAASHTDIRA